MLKKTGKNATALMNPAKKRVSAVNASDTTYEWENFLPVFSLKM
jgi:hypothetical protein